MRLHHRKGGDRGHALAFALWLGLLLTPANISGQQVAEARLEVVPDGRTWVQPEAKLRIHFIGDETNGYDVTFEDREGEKSGNG